MEKASSIEMDFEEWEVLPDTNHTFLDFNIESFVDMNYFICPSHQPGPPKLVEEEAGKKASIPADEREAAPIVDDELDRKFKDIGVVVPPLSVIIAADHRELVSQVFFKKLKEDEFADMKSSSKEFAMPMIEPGPIMMFDKEEEEEEEEDRIYRGEITKDLAFEMEELEKGRDGVEAEIKDKKPCGFGLSIWRWRLMGIGTLCSIGVAAASICIFILGGQQRQRQQYHNQRLQFQIYTDNKRIKQVVQQASRLNQALSAVRGVPMTRAHISFGGYYDGL